MQIKRVVTAVDADGKAVVQEEAVLAPTEPDLFPGYGLFGIWGTEGVVPPFGAQGTGADAPTFFPGPGGTRFGLFSLPPQERDAPPGEMPDEETMNRLVADAEEKVPGMLAAFEPDAPGFHTTPTIDYDIVLQGTLTLELDDGVEVELPPGTCVVQRGTRHAWRNYGTEEALLAYVIVSGES